MRARAIPSLTVARSARAIARNSERHTMHVISYSGGVQSTALLVLAAQQRRTNAIAVFVDLMQAEDPRTRRYVEGVAVPYCEASGIRLIRVEVDAISDIMRNPLHPKPPFRAVDGGFSTRQCTNHWKIRPFRRALRALMREHGLSLRKGGVHVALGISFDETERMSQPNVSYYQHVYPLIDLRLTRADCARLIANAGLPIPPKSACWFCPYTSRARVQEIARLHPDIKRDLVTLEATINDARARAGLPLLVIEPGGLGSACGGYCMT